MNSSFFIRYRQSIISADTRLLCFTIGVIIKHCASGNSTRIATAQFSRRNFRVIEAMLTMSQSSAVFRACLLAMNDVICQQPERYRKMGHATSRSLSYPVPGCGEYLLPNPPLRHCLQGATPASWPPNISEERRRVCGTSAPNRFVFITMGKKIIKQAMTVRFTSFAIAIIDEPSMFNTIRLLNERQLVNRRPSGNLLRARRLYNSA